MDKAEKLSTASSEQIRPICDTGDENNERGNWSSYSDFLLSLIGYSVGLINLCRFPYLCMKNGGGAFLIPYLACLFICGIPLFFLEMYLGQFSSLSPPNVFKVSPLFKGIAWGMLVICSVASVYYNLMLAWVLYYLGISFSGTLPWAECTNSWNTDLCSKRGMSLENVTISNTTENSSESYNTTNLSQQLKFKTPSEEFWKYKVLDLSSGIDSLSGVKWDLLLCHIVAWILVFACLSGNVKSIGKVVRVTATAPYLFLIILLIRGLTLPGAMDGIKFFIIPDFSKLKDLNVWGQACLQIFYSVGPGWGGILTISSYNKFHNNCLRDSILIPIVNCSTSIFGGLVIFSVIGFMAKEAGQPVSTVISSGPGLAFIAYPEAISKLPISPMWAIMFFVMLLTVGIDSQFGVLETVSSGICDEFHLHRKRRPFVTLLMCGVFLLLGIPFTTRGGMYIFQLIDWYCCTFSLMVISLLECVVLAYGYGWQRIYYDIEMMIGYRPGYLWSICWRFISPSVLLFIIAFNCVQMEPPTLGDYVYPVWATGIGWSIAMLSLLPIPLVAIIQIARAQGTLKQRISHLIKPTDDWGPAVEKYRVQYKYAKIPQKPSFMDTDV